MAMSNNDILKRVRYALDIRDIDMVEIFKTRRDGSNERRRS